ncbi:hypothetical protein ACIBG7_15235 [Nonomuraea sp. NPDC050328]|uniref:hypothetical protein n=1 Tax=Nonomuraea sp. NPDC050328 TaxID=3364361 RepID=UPI0037A0D29E
MTEQSEQTQYVDDVDAFLAGLKLPEAPMPICMRGDLQAQWEELEQRLEFLRRQPKNDSLGAVDPTRVVAEQMEALRTEMKEHVRVFLLRAKTRKEWSDLIKLHPPRKEDGAGAAFNPETFPVAALAACSVRPRMTEEQAGRVIDQITAGQWNELWGKVAALNAGSGEVPFSFVASEILSSTSRR